VTKTIVAASIDNIRRRICGEYLEMPGLRLTCAQAQRLWGLDQQTCQTVLESLINDGFLQRRDDGLYARLSDGAVSFPPMRMAKVPPMKGRRSAP
jgi:Fic family protein